MLGMHPLQRQEVSTPAPTREENLTKATQTRTIAADTNGSDKHMVQDTDGITGATGGAGGRSR